MGDPPLNGAEGALDDPLDVCPLRSLSARERDVVQQLVNGRSFREGASALYISHHTFRTHAKNVLAKLGVHSSLEAVSLAVTWGMRPGGLGPEAAPVPSGGGIGAAAFDAAPEAMAVLGPSGAVVASNRAMVELFDPEPPPESVEELLGGGTDETYVRQLGDVLEGRRPRFALERRLPGLRGGAMWAELVTSRLAGPGEGSMAVLVLRDVTQARVREDRLRWGAVRDELTGLGAPALVAERLDHALAHLVRGGGGAAVLLVDLEDFGSVNRHWGQSTGDRVLRDVAERLSEVIRPTDTICRGGPDEFVVCVEGLSGDALVQHEELHALAERLEASIARPDVGGMIGLGVAAAIGGAGTSQSGTCPEHLLEAGRTALADARSSGASIITRWITPTCSVVARSA